MSSNPRHTPRKRHHQQQQQQQQQQQPPHHIRNPSAGNHPNNIYANTPPLSAAIASGIAPNTSTRTNNVPTSDYESDAYNYLSSRPPPAPSALLNRTNTELNLGVLQRYLPSITAILSVAANAVVYAFSADAHQWEKSGVEGTLFVCEQQAAAEARACVFVLNRRGLNNVIVDLDQVQDFEVTPALLNFQMDDDARGGSGSGAAALDGTSVDAAQGYAAATPIPKVLGLWIHAEKEDTMATHGTLITELWKRARQARGVREKMLAAQQATNVGVGNPQQSQQYPGGALPAESVGPAMQAVGRRLSLSDLFGGKPPV